MASITEEVQSNTALAAHERGVWICGGVIVVAWAMAAWLPLGISIVTVFLFAGPHNWMEARYFLQRMPARWGPLRTYYLSGILGAFALAAASLALPSVAGFWSMSGEAWMTSLAMWNTALVVWVVWLAHLRRLEKAKFLAKVKARESAPATVAAESPTSDESPPLPWPLLMACGWFLIGLAWLAPYGWSLALVYVHPLIALWFLDRELARRRIPWRGAYRVALMALPLLLGALWWMLWSRPNLPGEDLLSLQITRHAGQGILSGVSTHLMVSTHVFLEMLHYAVWLLAIPSIGVKGRVWQLNRIPVARKSQRWAVAVTVVLAIGAAAVILLWAGFLANYPLTRNVYFSVAILHVLVEAPFLLRLL